jgi:hypothetical protein
MILEALYKLSFLLCLAITVGFSYFIIVQLVETIKSKGK